MRPANNDKQRRHRLATSKAMKAMAEANQCEVCGRKAAMKRHELDPWTIFWRCRWCGYERSIQVR